MKRVCVCVTDTFVIRIYADIVPRIHKERDGSTSRGALQRFQVFEVFHFCVRPANQKASFPPPPMKSRFGPSKRFTFSENNTLLLVTKRCRPAQAASRRGTHASTPTPHPSLCGTHARQRFHRCLPPRAASPWSAYPRTALAQINQEAGDLVRLELANRGGRRCA